MTLQEEPPDEITKLCVTGGAEAYVPLPGCVARTWHVPGPKMVMVEPETVQTEVVSETRVTDSPEEAVGDVETVAELPVHVWLPGFVKAIVWAVLVDMGNVWVTLVAAA